MTKLQEEVADLKAKYQHFRASFGAKPFLPDASKSAGPDPVLEEPDYGTGVSAEDQSLKVGPMGSLASGRVFDLKIAGQGDFQFSSKGGDQWKGKTERYLISCVPAVHALLQRVERQTQTITEEQFTAAVGLQLTSWTRDSE